MTKHCTDTILTGVYAMCYLNNLLSTEDQYRKYHINLYSSFLNNESLLSYPNTFTKQLN